MDKNLCLLIDDDPDDREIFVMALENAAESYKCIETTNGRHALEAINSDESLIPDFVFIDLNMPYMSGKECLQRIKNIPRLKNVPAIMYTTSSYEKDVEETENLGASHFLVKPSGMNTLIKILQEILNRKNLPFYLNIED